MSLRSKLVWSSCLALVVMIVGVGIVAQAKTNTFQGGYSNNAWEESRNWSAGHMPQSNEHVVIPKDHKVRMTSSGMAPILSLKNYGTITATSGVDIHISATRGIVNSYKIEGSETGKVILETGDGQNSAKIYNKVTGTIEGRTIILTTHTLINKKLIKGTDASGQQKSGTVKITAVEVKNYGTVSGGHSSKKETGADHDGGDVELQISGNVLVWTGAKFVGGDSDTKKGGDVKGNVKGEIRLRGRGGVEAIVARGSGKGGKQIPPSVKATRWVGVVLPTNGRAIISLPATPPIDPESIDGEITILDILDEGVQVYVTDLVGPEVSYPITIFTKRDDAFLYIGLEIDDLPFGSWEEFLNAGAREVYVAFDVNKDDEQFTAGDNILIFDLYEETVMDGFYPYGGEYAPDTYFGGTHDVVAAAYLFVPFSADNATLSVEFLLPLDSGDRIGADPALAPGQKIDIKIGLVFDTFELETQEHLILGILL